MPVLLLREQDVRVLVDIHDALQAVKLAFEEQAHGTGRNLARQRVRQINGTLHLMGAALEHRGYWGFKAYTATRNGVRFSIQLYNTITGSLLAILEADLLGQLRTGAASGVASKYLANPDSRVFGLIGSGSQAESQLIAVASQHELEEIRVYSRTAEHRNQFAAEMLEKHGLPVKAVDTIEDCVRGADIVSTITTSRNPLITAEMIQTGMHINAAGANAVIRTEIDPRALVRITQCFTDDLQQARLESGLFQQGYENNLFSWSTLHNFCDVVAGIHPGRGSQADVTLFASHGIALWDIALAAQVYERAQAANIGEKIEFLE